MMVESGRVLQEDKIYIEIINTALHDNKCNCLFTNSRLMQFCEYLIVH